MSIRIEIVVRVLTQALICAALAACGGGTGGEGGGATPNSAARPAERAKALAAAPAPVPIANLQPGQWLELPNTKLRSVAPNPPKRGYFPYIIDAWSGGTVDTARSRLLVWGGGHADYWGNEMYALDLPSMSVQRVLEPSPHADDANCKSALPDGTPTSRHTYDGLAYIAHADRFFSVDGGLSPCGFAEPATWTHDFTTGKWQVMVSNSPWGDVAFGTMAVYDPVSKLVYVKNSGPSFFAYSLENNQYTKLNTSDLFVDYHLSAAIDSKRRKFVMIGDGVQVIDLVTYKMTTMSTSNAPAFVTGKQSPGIAYDPVADRIVAWHGGDKVYALDMDTGAWQQVATNAGPTFPGKVQGTFGRWGYIPQYGVFALINDVDQNAWVFKLGAGAPPPPPPTDWKAVAVEGATFTVSGTQTVRYGAGTSWVEKSVTGTVPCTNAFFGRDPAFNVVKSCQVASTTTTPPPPPPPPTDWKTVAAEGATFTVSGTQTVRYGAGTSWVEKSVTGTVPCTNAFFGRDPAFNVVKSCQVVSTTTTPPPPPPPPTDWKTVAAEGASFTVSGTQTVRYGAGASWVEKSVTGTAPCTNAFFGNDPAWGVVKSCQVAVSTPTPPPPLPTANLDLSLVSAGGGSLLPFTVGQALRQGAVPAGQVLVSSTVPELQSVVKNRWPDGSAKFVILSGRLDLTANTWRTIGLSAAAAPATSTAPVSTADLKATGVTAAVQFASFGTASWSAGDWDTPIQVVAAGPQMSAWTFRKPLAGDAHLVAWLEVRAYKGGRVEVLPWLENGYLRVANPTAKNGTASFTLNGTTRFSQPLDLLHHQRAVLASGATLTHWAGADPQVTPRGNTAYLMSTRLVPNYRGVTGAGSALLSSLPTAYTPLAQASYPAGMGSAGYDPSIGLLPEWDAAYLTSGGDPRAYRAVVINAYAAGRYGTHFRDETTNRPPLFAAYPTLVIGSGPTGVTSSGASSTNTFTPTPGGASPPAFASSHHPSIGYMAYLLTGWNYFAEETQHVATLLWLKQNDTTRQGAKGIFETAAGANTTRGAAWALRTMAQAATVTPDADTALRAQFVNSLDANIAHYHGRYVLTPNNPLGLVQPYSDYNPGDPWESAIWMDDFFTAAFGYLKDLQSHSPASQAGLDAFLAWKYRSVVGRLGSGAPGTFNYRYAAPYTLNYAPSASSNFATGAGPWYADWGAVATAMAIPAADGGTSLQGSSGGDPSAMHQGYWGNMLPALAYAVDHAAAGASQAYDRLTSASNFNSNAARFDDTPVWGVAPRSK